MSEKKLHEKTISELDWMARTTSAYDDVKAISIPNLKKWTISIVKNCKNPIKPENGKIFPESSAVCGVQPVGRDKPIRCLACQRDIEKFELTEEDLK